MSSRESFVQCDSAQSSFACFRHEFSLRSSTIATHQGVTVSKSRVSSGGAWILFCCALEIVNCLVETVACSLVEEIFAFKIKVPYLFWSDSFTYHGLEYKYKMVGTDPQKSNETTVIPTVIIPLRFIFPDGQVFDAGTENVDGEPAIQRIIDSPIFQNYDF